MARRDGKRISNLSGMGQLIMDINSKRTTSEVYINQKVDVTNLVKYVKEKKKTNPDFTMFHAFLATLGKTIYNRKKLNYFVANRHLYEHNDVVVSFVAKTAFDDSKEEIMIMIPIKENDNADLISKKISSKVAKIRNSKKQDKKGANNVIDIVGKFPNIIRVPLVAVVKWMDKKGILPKFLCEDNLYYSSMIVSNLGSIKCGAIYHHLSDFGTCSSLVTIGEIKDEIVFINNKKETRKMCEFGITLDERVADGFYYAKAIKIFEYICANPNLLDEPMETKITVEIR